MFSKKKFGFLLATISVLLITAFFTYSIIEKYNKTSGSSLPPLTQFQKELSQTTLDARNNIPNVKIQEFIYKFVPVGTPTTTAKTILLEKGFDVKPLLPSNYNGGATLMASMFISDTTQTSMKLSETIILTIVEDRESEVAKIKSIQATTVSASL